MPYLKDIYREEPLDRFDPATELIEAMENQQPGGGETASLESGEATIVYELESNKRRAFLLWALGFSWADEPGAAARLHRANPQYHPVFPWMRAVSVSFSGFPPSAILGSLKEEEIYTGLAFNGTTIPSAFGPGRITHYGRYAKCYATVKFRDLPWSFYDDDQITSAENEVYRNCFFDVASSIEMLSAENGPIGQLKWNETGAGGPTVGTPITAAFGTLVSKDVFVLNWMWVCQEYLARPGAVPTVFYPKNILSVVGKVNSAAFAGFPAYTLLCQPPKFVRFRWPVATWNNQGGFYGYNVALPMQHFDPPQGAAGRGFRTLPWARNLKYYEAVRGDGVTHLLTETDFNVIFSYPPA